MSDGILSRSVTDPRGERLLDELMGQDLSILSLEDLSYRVERLTTEIERTIAIRKTKQGASAAAQALFKV